MAALKAILKSLDGLADPIKALYRKEGEEFQLDVEGMVPKAQLDEFRENNRELNRKLTEATSELKKFEGVDIAKWKEGQELERKVKEGELVKAGKIDEVLQSRLDPILKAHEAKERTWTEERTQMARDLDVLTIDTKLQEIAVKKGIQPTAVEDMLARGRRIFSRKEGKVVAIEKDGTPVLDKEGHHLTMDTWLDGLSSDAPHLFQASGGGGAQHNGNGSPGAGKIMKAGEFDKLSPAQQMETAKQAREGKIQIVD